MRAMTSFGEISSRSNEAVPEFVVDGHDAARIVVDSTWGKMNGGHGRYVKDTGSCLKTHPSDV